MVNPDRSSLSFFLLSSLAV